MSVLAEGIGSRAAGIAGATLTTTNLARARVFYLARLGFPLLHEGQDAFTFGAGTSTITVHHAIDECVATDPLGPRQSGLARISLWCARLDDVRAVADMLTAVGIEHSTSPIAGSGTDGVVFRDPDGIEWEMRVR